MDAKTKTWILRFSAKENPNIETALFDWPIVLQYDVKAKYRLISRKFFSPERSLNQPKATRVCIRSINQSNRSISVRLLFLFCSHVFLSRSYENRSKNSLNKRHRPSHRLFQAFGSAIVVFAVHLSFHHPQFLNADAKQHDPALKPCWDEMPVDIINKVHMVFLGSYAHPQRRKAIPVPFLP